MQLITDSADLVDKIVSVAAVVEVVSGLASLAEAAADNMDLTDEAATTLRDQIACALFAVTYLSTQLRKELSELESALMTGKGDGVVT